jgi:hypothetical protein
MTLGERRLFLQMLALQGLSIPAAYFVSSTDALAHQPAIRMRAGLRPELSASLGLASGAGVSTYRARCKEPRLHRGMPTTAARRFGGARFEPA